MFGSLRCVAWRGVGWLRTALHGAQREEARQESAALEVQDSTKRGGGGGGGNSTAGSYHYQGGATLVLRNGERAAVPLSDVGRDYFWNQLIDAQSR
jgi:hypothetical protein